MIRSASLFLAMAFVAAPAVRAGHGVGERLLLRHALDGQARGRLTALTVTYAPGAFSLPHHHDAAAFVYVLEGQVRSAVGDAPARVYGPGQSWFESPGAHHRICANASPRAPARMLVVFVGAPDAALSVPETGR